ncbi:unnamed protein product [Periconia digitata]|uniref:Uncharacterized protein n=1 Tax=Periconia digitata TaxID=1303443 RepID=A0A9W4UI57_9PLEO|nr:unnamed protein product [Periconia digitata]
MICCEMLCYAMLRYAMLSPPTASRYLICSICLSIYLSISGRDCTRPLLHGCCPPVHLSMTLFRLQGTSVVCITTPATTATA